MIKLTQEQRVYQMRVNRAHGVRPPQELEGTAERHAYCTWWARTLDARDARTVALTRERQARQDAALLPKPTGNEPRKRSGTVARAMDADAYTATVLLDKRVTVKVNPRSRRSVKGSKTGYECVVTRPNGAHLSGKPVCKGQTLWVSLDALCSPQDVADATPTGARAKRNAAKRKAVKAAVKPAPKVKAVRNAEPTRAEREREAVTRIAGHNNVASK